MQEHDARMADIHGIGNCRPICPGHWFRLQEPAQESLNGHKYLLTSVSHEAAQAFVTDSDAGDHYHNDFTCIALRVPFRPRIRTPRPVMAGRLTVVVTGPPGQEIHTDKGGHRMVRVAARNNCTTLLVFWPVCGPASTGTYLDMHQWMQGRRRTKIRRNPVQLFLAVTLKVRFFFDRRDSAARKGNMSCFIRVSQSWAGDGFGTVFIPRIGQEVIVGFIDGDCDRPVITGRLYHGLNKAPHHQAREETKSVIMTSSTPGKGGYNEICFEDRSGSEKIETHAAKDQIEVVENDLTTTVKRHHTIDVAHNRSLGVQQDETTTVGGSRALTVRKDERHTNAAGFIHKVGDNYVLKVNGNLTIDAAGQVVISGAKIILNG